jgi:hypothetical protein
MAEALPLRCAIICTSSTRSSSWTRGRSWNASSLPACQRSSRYLHYTSNSLQSSFFGDKEFERGGWFRRHAGIPVPSLAGPGQRRRPSRHLLNPYNLFWHFSGIRIALSLGYSRCCMLLSGLSSSLTPFSGVMLARVRPVPVGRDTSMIRPGVAFLAWLNKVAIGHGYFYGIYRSNSPSFMTSQLKARKRALPKPFAVSEGWN